MPAEYRNLKNDWSSEEAIFKWPPAVTQAFWEGLFQAHDSFPPDLLHSFGLSPSAGTIWKILSQRPRQHWWPCCCSTTQRFRPALRSGRKKKKFLRQKRNGASYERRGMSFFYLGMSYLVVPPPQVSFASSELLVGELSSWKPGAWWQSTPHLRLKTSTII